MNKRQYTKLFLEQAGMEVTDESIKEYLTHWWATPYSPLGFRLKVTGRDFLIQSLKLDYFKCYVKDDFNESYRVILSMSKYLTAPYYLTPRAATLRTLICFGETDRFMLAMMGGDLGQYLENFSR